MKRGTKKQVATFEEFSSVRRRREGAQRLAARQRQAADKGGRSGQGSSSSSSSSSSSGGKKRDDGADDGDAGGNDDDDDDDDDGLPRLPSFSERIGAFVESPELQFIITIFIGLDLLAATVELLIEGGFFDGAAYGAALVHVAKFLDYSSVFITLVFTLELLLLLFAFGLRILGHIGYTADFMIVGTSFYMQLAFNSKGALPLLPLF